MKKVIKEGFGGNQAVVDQLATAFYNATDIDGLDGDMGMREYLGTIAEAMGQSLRLMIANMGDIVETEDLGDGGPSEYGVDEAIADGVLELRFSEGLNG